MSAETYLGEFPVDIFLIDPYRDYSQSDWAMLWIEMYGQIDGSHHKAWVLDQVSRILLGTRVIVTEARWTDHEPELRFRLDDPTERYLNWRQAMLGGYDEDYEGYEYDYDEGVAP